MSTTNATSASGSTLAHTLVLRLEVEEFYARYVRAIDRRDPSGWVALFTPDGSYDRDVLRELHDPRHALDDLRSGRRS